MHNPVLFTLLGLTLTTLTLAQDPAALISVVSEFEAALPTDFPSADPTAAACYFVTNTGALQTYESKILSIESANSGLFASFASEFASLTQGIGSNLLTETAFSTINCGAVATTGSGVASTTATITSGGSTMTTTTAASGSGSGSGSVSVAGTTTSTAGGSVQSVGVYGAAVAGILGVAALL